jgi:hypothetical protein
MKIFRSPLLAVATLLASVCLLTSACSSLKSELGLTPTPAMMTTNAVGVVTITPPLAAQLNDAAPIAGATLPAPWGGIVQATLLLLAGSASAVATFHARKSAVASAASSASSLQAAMVSAPTAKT